MNDDDKPEPSAKEIQRKRILKVLNCSMCPPHGGENQGRRAKHGPKKPKKKNRVNK